jgi:hypothetical protein
MRVAQRQALGRNPMLRTQEVAPAIAANLQELGCGG